MKLNIRQFQTEPFSREQLIDDLVKLQNTETFNSVDILTITGLMQTTDEVLRHTMKCCKRYLTDLQN